MPLERVAAQVLLLAIDFSWRPSENCPDHPKRGVYIWSEHLLFRPVWKHLHLGVLIFEVCPGCGGTGRGQAEATTPPAPAAETSALVPSTRADACPCPPRGTEIFEQSVLLCWWCLPPQNASENFSNTIFGHQAITQSYFLQVEGQSSADALTLLFGWEANQDNVIFCQCYFSVNPLLKNIRPRTSSPTLAGIQSEWTY